MSNYYEKRTAKVRIANELCQRGWKIYGFKEDQSDSMTDYYSPADWEGVATKNGYVLVIDNKYCCYSEQEIKRYNNNYKAITEKDQQRINNLKDITVLRGATIGEEENAKSMIQKIEAKYSNEGVSRYEVIDRYPKYQKNSKGCIWHIEKDGALVDRGNKLTIFADVPESYVFDINTMEFKENYKYIEQWEDNKKIRKERTLNEYEEKAIKEFKTFILRLERAVNGINSCGDGTEETEKEGLKQQDQKNLKKVTETITKKVLEMQEVERTESLKIGDVFFESGYGNLKVIEVTDKVYKVVKLGSKSRGYKESKAKNAHTSWTKMSVDRGVKNGFLKIYNIVEVEKIETIEKWVRVNNTKSKVATNTKNKNDIEITYNEEKNGIELSFNEKPEQKVIDELKENGFRWHRAKKIWYAKDTEERRSFINGLIEDENQEELKENNINNDLYDDNNQIESGFTFDSVEKKDNKSEVKEMENNFNFDDILSKFDSVEIKNENRLSSEDLAEMKKLQNNLDNMREQFKLYLEFYENNKIYNIENKEVTRSIYKLKDDFVINVIFKECEKFISEVYYYFRNKYNINLDIIKYDTDYSVEFREFQANKNLNWFMNELNYNLLLDDIFNQLGGVDFKTKELEELKETFKYKDVNLKGNNITIQNYIYFDDLTLKYSKEYEISYHSREEIKNLFNLIEKINNKEYTELKEGLINRNIDPIGVFELDGEKIKALQVFKNGNVKLTFNSGIEALKIAQEYLNYNVAA